MKLLVIGSNGRAGSRIYDEAAKRGFDVVGTGRNTSDRVQLVKDLYELTLEDIQGYDAIVSAFATWGDQSLHLSAAQYLDNLVSRTSAKLLIVGGAGSLKVDGDTMLKDTSDFPEAYLAVANGMTEALKYLEESGVSNWLFFSPSAVFEPGGGTGKYTLGGDALLVNGAGKSFIAMEDYALATLDVLEANELNRQRFTAVTAV